MYAGVAGLLRRWSAEVPLAVASGALRAEIDLVLGTAGVADAIAVIVSADDGLRTKPAPDPYLKALALLERQAGVALDPARTVAIEDSRFGVESARAAGMRTVAVTTSFPPSAFAGADLVAGGLPELTLETLDALCAQ